jgi:hypothetical protein
MNETIKWVITQNNINVYIRGECFIIPKTNHTSNLLIDALKEKNNVEVKRLLKLSKV